MRLLLDTHALAWWWVEDKRLPPAARAAIADPDNTVLVSAATAWELATKHRLGKWPDVAAIVGDLDALLRRSRFGVLPISLPHAHLAGTLAGPHRDPFDRMLIAQCRHEDLPIVSGDAVFAQYDVRVIWRE
jgi:PIN domain nuclease of toxin-antitoxin system